MIGSRQEGVTYEFRPALRVIDRAATTEMLVRIQLSKHAKLTDNLVLIQTHSSTIYMAASVYDRRMLKEDPIYPSFGKGSLTVV